MRDVAAVCALASSVAGAAFMPADQHRPQPKQIRWKQWHSKPKSTPSTCTFTLGQLQLGAACIIDCMRESTGCLEAGTDDLVQLTGVAALQARVEAVAVDSPRVVDKDIEELDGRQTAHMGHSQQALHASRGRHAALSIKGCGKGSNELNVIRHDSRLDGIQRQGSSAALVTVLHLSCVCVRESDKASENP